MYREYTSTVILSLNIYLSRSKKVDLVYFILFFIFIFFSIYFSIFLFFRTTRVRVDWSCGHISHKTDHETWENFVEDLKTDDIIQYGHHMLAS